MKSSQVATQVALSLAMIFLMSCSHKMNLAESSTYFASAPGVNVKPGETITASDVSTKVLKNFYQTYGKISDVRWFKSTNGFAATFKLNAIDNTIYFKPGGIVDGSIHYYFQEKLAEPVKNLVKTLFANYSIINIAEVQKNGITAFYVKVQDATSIKTLKIVGEEWEVVEDLVKR